MNQDKAQMSTNPDDYYECDKCGQSVYMGDLAAVMFHEHRGITDRMDLSGIWPGKRVERSDG